jgi:hypothetical protein
MAYKNFRVRTPVKTFRDLEAYQESIKLAAEIFKLKPPSKLEEELSEEIKILKQTSKLIPKLIVESYNDKFGNFALADKKLEIACQAINLIIAKLDFLEALIEEEKFKISIAEILKKFQRLKIKILNLKRSWERVFGAKNS